MAAANKMQQEGEMNTPHSSWDYQQEYNGIKKLFATLFGQLDCAMHLVLHRATE